MAAPVVQRAQITHVLFDMDGLLLDTETFYTIAQTKLCALYGKTFTWAVKSKIMGKKALDAAQTVIDELQMHDVITAEKFVADREATLLELFPSAQLMPGAERLVRHLHAHGIAAAVATSSSQRHFDLKTSGHGDLFALFSHVVTGDHVTHGKPAPEIFLKAAAAFASPPAAAAHTLVFEDAPSGIQAALAASMHCVMVPDENLDKALIPADASQVLTSLQHFVPEEWGLPPYAAAV